MVSDGDACDGERAADPLHCPDVTLKALVRGGELKVDDLGDLTYRRRDGRASSALTGAPKENPVGWGSAAGFVGGPTLGRGRSTE